jgi:hypothetical protein
MSHLQVPEFRLHHEEQLEIYYVPFDYLNERARIVLIGITPGHNQMLLAYGAVRQALAEGCSPLEACQAADREASFAGSMRTNLVTMLDGLGVPAALGIKSATQLFDDRADLAHTTSAIRDAVFVDGKNYTGHTPRISETPVLRHYVTSLLAEEVARVERALLVPLGAAVSPALQILVDQRLVDPARCLFGFPHPSGANGHRARHYAERRASLKRQTDRWFRETA